MESDYCSKGRPKIKLGWIYQEQLLSRRVIHFTEEELICVCREYFKCECRFEEHT